MSRTAALARWWKATAGASNARYPRLRGEHGHVLDGKPDLNESPGHDLDLQPGHASR